ncbi:MAK10-like protein, partial [Tanacetum coccineum]
LATRVIGTPLSSPKGTTWFLFDPDTIRLEQNGCSFHGLWSEDPNQHLKDFLKLVDSLDLDVANRERMRLCLFQFSLCDQASNWLERLPSGSISTWEDHTTRLLAQLFPSGRTAKLHNDILMFQKHQGKSFSKACTRFKDLLQKVTHHGINLWLQVQIFYDHANPATRRTIDQSAGGKLHNRNAEESWALLEDLALYDNESWNDPKDFAKPVKAISLPQDVPMNKITSSCEVCSGPYDTQYCMENPVEAFVEYASPYCDRTVIMWEVSSIITSHEHHDQMAVLIGSHHEYASLRIDEVGEQNRNTLSPKRVHFVNSIIILNKEDEAKEVGSVKSSVTENKDHEITVESEEEFKEETDD